MNKIHLEILTPAKNYLETDVDFIEIKTSDFLLGLLPNHAPLVTTLDIAPLNLKNDGVVTSYALHGGVMHVKKGSHVIILANAIESKEEIDIERATRSKERALKRKEDSNSDLKRAELSLKRALTRLLVSSNNN